MRFFNGINWLKQTEWPIKVGLFYLLVAFLLGCSAAKPIASRQPATFYKQLQQHCGKKLTGTVLYPGGKEAPFQGMHIWLEIDQCNEKEIRMPIKLDDKIYRTLILGRDNTGPGYTLRHENKRPNGTQAEFSMYGGQTTNAGSNFLLVFPADSYSRQLMGAEMNYVWSLAINSDRTTLSYMVETDGKLNLQLDFDLTTTPVQQ